MNYKYMIDGGVLELPVMKIEVGIYDGANSKILKVFPYDPAWWAKQDKNLGDFEPMSVSLNIAVNKARAFYDSLPQEPAPEAKILVGRID